MKSVFTMFSMLPANSRAALMVQISPCQALAEGLKENSILTNLNLWENNIGPEGAKAWCLARMVRKKGIARSKIQALESEVSELKEI